MRIRDFLFFTGRLGCAAYWLALITMVVSFLVLAIMFPAFVVMLLPFSYLAFCLLANRLRAAGLPGFLAVVPFGVMFGTVLRYLLLSLLTMGGGGSGTGGSSAMNRFYRRVETFGNEQLGWIVSSIYLVAGLLPTRGRRIDARDGAHAERFVGEDCSWTT